MFYASKIWGDNSTGSAISNVPSNSILVVNALSNVPSNSVPAGNSVPASNSVPANNTVSNPSSNLAPTARAAQKENLPQFCPSADTLKKKGQYWTAPDGWISYYQSFIDDIDQFVDAHWIGVGVGKIVCRYASHDPTRPDFPVTLEKSTLFVLKPIANPKVNAWGSEVKGVINCISHHVQDCPYLIAPADNKIDYEKLLETPNDQKQNTPIQGTVF